MKRPLFDPAVTLFGAILLAIIISLSPATAYNVRAAGNDGVTGVLCEITADCNGPAVFAFEVATPKTGSGLETARSSLRAGIAVGKCVARKARLVLRSLALAAHHGATALVRTPLGVF